MEIKFKKLNESAVIPYYAKPGDAGLDLTCTSVDLEELINGIITYHTGIAVEIPEGYVGLVFPRSSISKTGGMLANSVGVIDSGYRGEILVKVRFAQNLYTNSYNVGDRVAQMVIIPYPKVKPIEALELGETVRGLGGFGSSGN